MLSYLLNLSRPQKQLLMLSSDLLLLVVALWLAFALRLGEWLVPNVQYSLLFGVALVLAVPVFLHFGLYRSVIRYIGQQHLLSLLQATTFLVLAWLLIADYLLPEYLYWQPVDVPHAPHKFHRKPPRETRLSPAWHSQQYAQIRRHRR